jgi:PAS domain S-box-containing protein
MSARHNSNEKLQQSNEKLQQSNEKLQHESDELRKEHDELKKSFEEYINEHKQIEEQLQNEQLLLRIIIDNIPDSIYSKDLTCRKTFVNLAEVHFMGATSASEVLGKDDFEVYPKELAEMFFTDDQSVMLTGTPVLNREEYILDEKNEKRYLLSSKIPLRDKHSRIIGLIGIGRDVTDRKKAEQELKFKNQQLIQANAEKDKFFSIIAHDLRSPFNAFLGFTRIMVEELNTMSLEEIKEIVLSLRKSATNLYTLLENLLEWSRMQRGIIKFHPVTFPLASNIRESIELIIGSAQKKEIVISYDIPDALSVFADVHMVETIMRNFISNAVKFTPRRGKIKISARKTADNYVEISVHDTGVGMTNELMVNLFRLIEQTGRKGTEGESSTGLGLIICKDFVEKHEGKIWVESEVGKGSAFYFTLPAGKS